MQPRNKRLSLRLNAEEYANLKQLAESTGLKMEPTIRSLIMGITLKPRPPDEYRELLRELSAIGNNVNQIAKAANAKGYASKEDVAQIKEMQKQLWQEAETSADALIESLDAHMGDVAMNVYVTKDGQMAGFDFETTLTTEAAEESEAAADETAETEESAADAEAGEATAETVKVTGTVAFAGGYNMLANVDAVITMENSAGESVTFTAAKTGTYEADKSYTAGFNGTMESGEESFSLNYDGSYQAEDGTYEISLELLEGEESQMKLTSNGYFENVVKGESFDLYMDSVKIETPILTGETDYLEFSGSYQAGPLETAVEIPEGEDFDLLAGTEADYQAVLTELSGNVFSLMMQLYQ